MKPERAFVAERMLARHSPELLSAGPPPVELAPQMKRCGERMARLVAPLLAPLAGGEAPQVRLGGVREIGVDELGVTIAPLAANSLLALGPQATRMIASAEAEAVLRMVDRAFGGQGRVPDPLPDAFPLSAELMIARLEGLVAQALGQAMGGKEPLAVQPLDRAGALAEILPFAEGARLIALTLEIEEAGGEGWSLTLAAAVSGLEHLFGHSPAAETRPEGAVAQARSPVEEPFAAMPLTLSAVIVDTRMPFSALAALHVGQVIPVAVARQVPIMIGDRCIAHGTVGALDDRVAVQLTQAFDS